MSTEPKPTLPASYVVPKVWEPAANLTGMNRPTAGKRSDAELPKGEHPLQLYSLGTPNGVKVTVLLEELGVDYDAWTINIMDLDQFKSGFVDINPNSKIPALLDYSVEGAPQRVFESGSIMFYLAEKYGKFIPKDPRQRTECMNWLFWQMGGAPFMGGGFGHFYKYAPVHIEYAIDRYTMEVKRQLDVLDQHLADKEYLAGEYSIADMATAPWVGCLDQGYNAAEFLQLASYKNVTAWMERVTTRDAYKRGKRVNGFSADAVRERHSINDFK
eukprot:NODE_1381_length_941_cov_341.170404_g1064_i0.p1 GENE.NODE_1381_length_941_cov_341.170404_g1064_i0~~NODE_1381_length_941_cov_341.170404_g1064_i0.p1  ORF type:complete len:290 (-),score=96.41 NODE_1381_length_941_cov_341.170404_g1064_i0:70-885(-)